MKQGELYLRLLEERVPAEYRQSEAYRDWARELRRMDKVPKQLLPVDVLDRLVLFLMEAPENERRGITKRFSFETETRSQHYRIQR